MSRKLPFRKRGATVITVELPNDGVSDCSKPPNDAINSLPEEGGTVWLPYQKTGGFKDCIYRINTTANTYTSPKRPNHGQPYGIKLRSNMLLQLEPGVQLRAMPTNVARAYVIFAMDVHDIEIANGAIIGDRHEHTNPGKGTDEWGHGMQLLGVRQATVRSIYISDCEGDGICVGRGPSSRTDDLIICDVISTRNRRQALSITNGDNISVFDSEFSYTHGTAPQDGIDIEPDGTGQVNNVIIDNCILRGNEASGIEVNASHGSSIRNLTITNCVLRDNVYSGFFTVQKGTAVLDNGVLYEWCHGIQIIGAQHVTVRACIISDCTGDGMCVGRYNGVDPSDIIICDVVCTGNRRQALSLTGGDTLQVYDSEFSNTYGTAPQNGIDIEPMGGANLSNITIDNCLIRGNSGDGIELNANGTATSVTNLTVQNCLLAENYWHGIAVHGSGTIDTGGIYGNAFYQNGNIGLSLADSPTNYTIGALNKDGNFTNNFANNNVGTYSYPNNTSSDVNGYVAGDDMHLGPDVIGSSSNVVRYNRFFS